MGVTPSVTHEFKLYCVVEYHSVFGTGNTTNAIPFRRLTFILYSKINLWTISIMNTIYLGTEFENYAFYNMNCP